MRPNTKPAPLECACLRLEVAPTIYDRRGAPLIAKPRTVDEWAVHFQLIYMDRNKRRTWKDLSHSLVARLDTMKSPKYIERHTTFVQHFSVSMGWLFGLYNKLLSSSKSVTIRSFGMLLLCEYPLSCPVCGKAQCEIDTCPYSSSHRKANRQHNAMKARQLLFSNRDASLPSLQGWAQTINSIYTPNATRSREWLGNKVGEEWVELDHEVQSIRSSRDQDALLSFYEEVADVFTWTCILGARALHEHLATDQCPPEHRTLDDLLWTIYQRGCPRCWEAHPSSLPCTCPETESDPEVLPLFDTEIDSVESPVTTAGQPSINVNPSFTFNTGGASATAIAAASASSTQSLWLDIYQHVLADSSQAPELAQSLKNFREALESATIDLDAVRKSARTLIQSAPNLGRARSLARLAASLVTSIAANLISQPISDELQAVASEIPGYVELIKTALE